MALAWKAGWVNSPRGFESRILRNFHGLPLTLWSSYREWLAHPLAGPTIPEFASLSSCAPPKPADRVSLVMQNQGEPSYYRDAHLFFDSCGSRPRGLALNSGGIGSEPDFPRKRSRSGRVSAAAVLLILSEVRGASRIPTPPCDWQMRSNSAEPIGRRFSPPAGRASPGGPDAICFQLSHQFS